jgi:hypothetical protein
MAHMQDIEAAVRKNELLPERTEPRAFYNNFSQGFYLLPRHSNLGE